MFLFLSSVEKYFLSRPPSSSMDLDPPDTSETNSVHPIASLPGASPVHHGPLYLASRCEADPIAPIFPKKRMLDQTKPSFPPSKKTSV